MQITYGTQPTQFGICLLALTNQQICWLSLHAQITPAEMLLLLKTEFPVAEFTAAKSTQELALICTLITQIFITRVLKTGPLLLAGTTFQKQVWLALLEIPIGTTTSYSHIAQQINRPLAIRAVASAIARNKISILIPCHRVIRKSGQINQYRWGSQVKTQLLAWEFDKTKCKSKLKL